MIYYLAALLVSFPAKGTRPAKVAPLPAAYGDP
jgi:hypothetical protein